MCSPFDSSPTHTLTEIPPHMRGIPLQLHFHSCSPLILSMCSSLSFTIPDRTSPPPAFHEAPPSSWLLPIFPSLFKRCSSKLYSSPSHSQSPHRSSLPVLTAMAVFQLSQALSALNSIFVHSNSQSSIQLLIISILLLFCRFRSSAMVPNPASISAHRCRRRSILSCCNQSLKSQSNRCLAACPCSIKQPSHHRQTRRCCFASLPPSHTCPAITASFVVAP